MIKFYAIENQPNELSSGKEKTDEFAKETEQNVNSTRNKLRSKNQKREKQKIPQFFGMNWHCKRMDAAWKSLR